MNHDAPRTQEAAFSICMGTVAWLGRANPLLRYPEILWAFAALLLFNLGYHAILRRRGGRLAAFLSVAVNGLLVAGILAVSGGADSCFWPMYLLPIFTASMSLERRDALFAWALPAGFLSYFYIEALWSGASWNAVELMIKLSVLALASGITFQVAIRERESRRALESARAELDRLNSQVQRDGHLAGQTLHDFNNPLTVVLASAELLLQSTPPDGEAARDLQRIVSAARRCAELTHLLGTRMAPYRSPAEASR